MQVSEIKLTSTCPALGATVSADCRRASPVLAGIFKDFLPGKVVRWVGYFAAFSLGGLQHAAARPRVRVTTLSPKSCPGKEPVTYFGGSLG